MEIARPWEILALGPKRMAHTLLAYAKPITERLPRDYTLDELRATLAFAAAVWNAMLIRDIREAVAHLTTNMTPRLRVSPARGMAAIRRLLARRYRHFGSDHHFVVAVNVYDDGTDFSVAAIGICPDPSCCGPQARA